MADNISEADKALQSLELCISELSVEKQRCVFESMANFIDAQFTPVDLFVERRPQPPTNPTAEQVQTVVNRLREKAKQKA